MARAGDSVNVGAAQRRMLRRWKNEPMLWRRKHRGSAAGESDRGISVNNALSLMARGAVVADVRGRREFERGHLPGSKLVDVAALRDDPVAAIWGDDPLADTDKPVIVVSSTGMRANVAASLMRQAGRDSYSLAGGLTAWARDGQTLIPGPER